MASFGGSGADQRTVFRSAQFTSGGYGPPDSEAWTPADHDAPTEEYAHLPGYPRGQPYGRSGSSTAARATTGRAELRLVLGILCILGGLVSGAGAIVLALWPQ